MSNYNFNELTYKIKQSWYHVETSFSGKNDDRATNILYHWREIFDLEIECSNRDNSGTLSWNLPLRLFKLNIYARNLGNNEILYFDATENNAKERTVLLFLPEIDKLPVLDLAGNKYYRTIRLEFNYTTDNKIDDFDNKTDIPNFKYSAYITLNRRYYNKCPEFKITTPYGWRIEEAISNVDDIEKTNADLLRLYNDLTNRNRELKKTQLNRKVKTIKKDIRRINKSIRKIKRPFYLFVSDDKRQLPICSSITPITEIHSQKLEYSALPYKKTWDNEKSKIDENKPFLLSLNIKAKPSLIATELFPYLFVALSSALIVFIRLSCDNIVADMTPSIAMCIGNLNIGVFAYFTYNKLTSIGYSFKNNKVIRACFAIGFFLTVIAIVIIVILHCNPNFFEDVSEKFKNCVLTIIWMFF